MIHCLTVVILDLGRQIVSDVAVVLDLVLDDERHISRHRQLHLRGQRRGLGERVEVATGKGQSDWLLHLDDNGLLFLVH